MRDEELDALLSESLASYSAVEPRAGLAQRVVSRVRKPVVPWWWIGVPAVAAIAVVAVAFVARWEPVPLPVVQRAPVVVTAAPPPVEVARSIQPARRKRRVAEKQSVFPMPAPLTGEERALLALVQRDPAAAVQISLDMQKQNSEPIEIASITIAPLRNGGTQ
jgi:hypothetical protein